MMVSIYRLTPGEQGLRSGESTRLPPMWSGFGSPIRCLMWAEFVGSLPAPRDFSLGTPVFPSPQKPTFLPHGPTSLQL